MAKKEEQPCFEDVPIVQCDFDLFQSRPVRFYAHCPLFRFDLDQNNHIVLQSAPTLNLKYDNKTVFVPWRKAFREIRRRKGRDREKVQSIRERDAHKRECARGAARLSCAHSGWSAVLRDWSRSPSLDYGIALKIYSQSNSLVIFWPFQNSIALKIKDEYSIKRKWYSLKSIFPSKFTSAHIII